MKREKIMETFRQLAKSQGSYGRLYENLKYLKTESPSDYNKYMEQLEGENFKDAVDLVIWLES